MKHVCVVMTGKIGRKRWNQPFHNNTNTMKHVMTVVTRYGRKRWNQP